jgi:putative hydrolase of the HAD superfamily
LGVISNSDGRIHLALERVGLADCFGLIVDSAVVGYRKPDPRIFQAALQKAGAEPRRSMYVGDIYSADYVASRKSGMQAVLMDVAGVYRETDYIRIDALDQLPALLRTSDQ